MKVVVQRVRSAKVEVNDQIVGQIDAGLLVLAGYENADTPSDVAWICAKIVNLRIFNDAQGVMNQSLMDIKGGLLLVSQFTLHASTKKGNRPSYIHAAAPEAANSLYELTKTTLNDLLQKPIETGIFRADMQVSLVNSGPVTIIIDSQNRV